MGKHYSKEELDLYRHQQMSVLGRISCTSHLKECPECAKRMKELEADDKLIKELKASIQLYQELSQTNLFVSNT